MTLIQLAYTVAGLIAFNCLLLIAIATLVVVGLVHDVRRRARRVKRRRRAAVPNADRVAAGEPF